MAWPREGSPSPRRASTPWREVRIQFLSLGTVDIGSGDVGVPEHSRTLASSLLVVTTEPSRHDVYTQTLPVSPGGKLPLAETFCPPWVTV